VPKPRDFNGSVGAVGGHVLKAPTFFGGWSTIHISQASTPLLMRRATFSMGRDIMNRRTAFVLAGMTLLGSVIAALPQTVFAQSDPFLGTWQSNLTKSKYSPGPARRSGTLNLQAEGQNVKATLTGTDANGNPFNVVVIDVLDGIAHPVTGIPNYDAAAHTRVDAYTQINSHTKAGKLVDTVTLVVSPDGKTLTVTMIGIDANGRGFNNILLYDKQ
jgi:hypothetical protein